MTWSGRCPVLLKLIPLFLQINRLVMLIDNPFGELLALGGPSLRVTNPGKSLVRRFLQLGYVSGFFFSF